MSERETLKRGKKTILTISAETYYISFSKGKRAKLEGRKNKVAGDSCKKTCRKKEGRLFQLYLFGKTSFYFCRGNNRRAGRKTRERLRRQQKGKNSLHLS